MAISTNGTVIARLAGGLYNTVISNATYLEVAATDPSALANTLYSRDFASKTDLAVATTLVTNLGLSSVTGLANWVAAQLTAAGSAKGAKIVSLLNDFAALTSDTTYGAFATAFNAKVDTALAASQKAGSVEGTFATSGAVTGATFTLTAGIESVVGTGADDVINASAVNAVTGAALTTLSIGDKIDGGSGRDTLNITTTADNNKVLPTAGDIKNVEVINITGANNLGTTTTAAAAASAGAKQVQVLDIGNLSLKAEQQTVNFGDIKVDAAGTITVAGVTVTLAAADTGKALADKVVTALTANTAYHAKVSSYSVADGLVTINYKASAGDVAAVTVSAGTATFAATQQVTAASGVVVAETKTSSAEIQSFAITTKAAANTNTITFGNNTLGTGQVVYTSASGLADTAAEAAAVANAINTLITAADVKVALLERAETSGSIVKLVFKTTSADATATTVTANAGIVVGAVSEDRKGGEVDHVVSINGAQYTVTSVVNPDILSATAATALAAQNTSKNALRTAINTELTKILGDSVTVGSSDDAGEIKLTSKTSGTSIPGISVTSRDSAANLVSVDAADAATVANAEITSASGAVAQQIQYTVGGTVAVEDSFTIYVNGVNYGTINPAATSTASAATGIAAALNTVLGAGVATALGGVVTVTAPVAGAPLPVVSIAPVDAGGANLTFARTNTRDNVDVLGTTTTASTASVSGATFTGSEEIWLVGTDSNKTSLTVTTQTAGLNAVTGLDNKITFGATGALAVQASTGTVDIAGAASGLAVSGTTGTLALTNVGGTTVATALKSISANMSGASSFDVSGLGQLTTVTSTGAGAVTVNPKTAATKLATVTTGAGADTVRINTATAKDDLTTASVDETISAVVNTTDGNDTVRVATSGLGNTTVNTGEGNDTAIITGVSTGTSTIDLGAGNDTADIRAITLGSLPNLSITAGAGNDTLTMAGAASYSAVDYLRMKTAITGFEAVKFTSQVGNSAALDASKLEIGTVTSITFNDGASNSIVKVGADHKLVLARAAEVATATDFVPTSGETSASGLTAVATGYLQGTGSTTVATFYGGGLDVSVSGNNTVALTLQGSSAVVGVTATGASTAAKSYNPTVTIGSAASDVQSLTVNLTSARGTSTNAVNEYVAAFDAGTIAETSATTYNQHLENLATLKATGTGSFTVNTGSVSKLLAKLTTVDVSGMTALSDLDVNGLQESTKNWSTSSITLNANVTETVILGGARDTIVTTSTVAEMDTIQGFQLTAQTGNALLADTNRSDSLNVLSGTDYTFAKFVPTTATTLSAALTEAGAQAGAALVFNFGGDTYVYVDLATGSPSVLGLDDGDYLVKLVGTANLDLLIGAAA
jgi:hypothetical protein